MKQIMKLIAVILENLPDMTNEVMQKWIENPKAVKQLLSGFVPLDVSPLTPPRSWREQDGVIYFSVTSDGTTGEGWISRLESKEFHVSDYVKSILRSKDFKPTKGVTTEVAVLKGTLFEDNKRITRTIRAEAKKRKFTTPNAEVSCLIREKFTDKEIEAMGLYLIITMHEPIKDSDGDPDLLGASRDGFGRWLRAFYDNPDNRWSRENGFAFAVSQVSS